LEESRNECYGDTYQYEFDLVSPRDEAVYAACLRARDRTAACFPGSSLDDCDRQAHVRNSTSIDMYNCLAATPCGQSTEHCFGPPSNMGTHFCAQLGGQCDFGASWCSDSWMGALDAAGPYYGKGVVDAFLACADEPGCKNIGRCADAWLAAVATAQ